MSGPAAGRVGSVPTDAQWPADWNDRVAGIGCEMGGSPRADSDRYGIRIHSTPDVEAMRGLLRDG
jgi:hypothetical protein